MSSIATLATATAAAAAIATTGMQAAPQAARTAQELQLKTERVVIFKDGHGLFVKAATATADSRGEVYTSQVPESAVLGSFWAFADGAEIRAMRAERVPAPVSERQSTCVSIAEILRANPGKQVTLTLQDGEVSGTLVQLLDLPAERSPAPEGPRWSSAHLEERDLRERELVPRGGDLVVLDGADKARRVIPVAQVKSVSGRELSTTCVRSFEASEAGKRLTFDLGPSMAGKRVALRILYFTPGVRWIPTYRVKTGKGAKAEVALQGEILNEVEDFEGAEVNLVVGVPNFRFKEAISPLTLERTMRQALAEAAPNLMGNANSLSNALFTQRASEWRGGGSPEPGGASELARLAPELTGSGEQDLFVYTAKALSLKKGERAAVPLWRSQAPQRHVYTLDVDLGEARAESSDAGSPLRLERNAVWHQLELTDDTNVPWTTGAALLLDGDLPLGQDLLTYTPSGGRTLLPITVAVDVRGSLKLEEVDRKHNALRVDGESFSLVRRKASVRLINHKKERAVVRVSVATAGKLEQASDGAQVSVEELHASDYRGVRAAKANPRSVARWEVTLEPGQTKELTCGQVVYE